MNPARPPSDLIILGASVRAAAASAQRAGLRAWCCDLYADRDLDAIAHVADRCPSGAYPEGLARWLAAKRPPGDAPVLLTGAMENHLPVVAAVTADRPTWTPTADAMRRARRPDLFRDLDLPPPVVPCAVGAVGDAAGDLPRLSKPRRGSAGRGIRPWRGPGDDDPARYVQERVEGEVVSAVFCAFDPTDVRCLGVTRQLIGDAAFGAAGFQYCGNIGPVPVDAALRGAWAALGGAVAGACGLRGIFGIDAILEAGGDLRPLEVNPRYPAGVEVLERAGAAPVLAALRGTGPWKGIPVAPADAVTGVTGKAVVHAREAGAAADFTVLSDTVQVADVPAVGTPLRRGGPVCTVLAEAADASACLAALRAGAARVYDALRRTAIE